MADQSILTPAQFGENLFARVFTPEAIIRQIDRSITEREIAIDMPNDPTPVPLVRVSTTGIARIAPLGLRVHGLGRFDALVHVDIKPLTVVFNLGGVEMWDIEVDATLEVRLVLLAPATLRIELGVPTAESIQVSCLNANDNWGISKGEVEKSIRSILVETLQTAARDSEQARTINLESQIRSSMDAPAPVEVTLAPASEQLPGLKLGVNGAYVYRDSDGDWILRARAAVQNGTSEKVVFGRSRFELGGWTPTIFREDDFPAELVLPPGSSMEGNLGFSISGDRPPPRAVWFQVDNVGEVPWRRKIQVAEAPAQPIRHAPWPPGGRIACAATSAAHAWIDNSNDPVVSLFVIVRNQGHTSYWLPNEFFGAKISGRWGMLHGAHSTFSEGLLLPAQRQITALVTWYWPKGHTIGGELSLRFGPPKSPYVEFPVRIVAGERMCVRV